VVCDLQVQIDGLDVAVTNIQNTLNTLNADYDVDCLSGVTNSSDTHAVLQAVIDKLCQFIIDVDLTYVKIADIDTYIQNYLNSIAGADLYSSKMVPYIAYEYYGPLVDPLDPTTGFGPTGAGFGKWINVFLCNGDNGTPDKRGRVAVGVTSGMNGSIPMDSAVNPALGNPSYTIGNTSNGTNKITLTATQLASHTHANVLNFNDPEHFHYQYAPTASNGSGAVDVSTTTYPNFRHDLENGLSYRTTGTSTLASIGKTSSNSTGITCTLTNVNAGGDEPHDNFQPGIGAYYIMYIP
jgi:microcystin-dependent protein